MTDGTSVYQLSHAGKLVRRVDVGASLDDVAVGLDAVLGDGRLPAMLFQIDQRSGGVLQRIRLVHHAGLAAPTPIALAAGEGAVWVLNGNGSTVTRIDPRLGRVVDTIHLGIGRRPDAIAVGAGAAWVATPATARSRGSMLAPMRCARSASAPPSSTWTWPTGGPGSPSSRELMGGGRADGARARSGRPTRGVLLPRVLPRQRDARGHLIVADLGPQGSGRGVDGQALQVSDAIRFVLARARVPGGPATRSATSSATTSSIQTGFWGPDAAAGTRGRYARDRRSSG